MGYTTTFNGTLDLKKDVSVDEIRKLKGLLESEYSPEKYGRNYIQLELNSGLNGLEWDGGEKCYGMEETVQWILDEMGGDFLTGSFQCQGEEYDDRWYLQIKDGKAIRVEQPRLGQKVICPRCDEEFVLEAE